MPRPVVLEEVVGADQVSVQLGDGGGPPRLHRVRFHDQPYPLNKLRRALQSSSSSYSTNTRQVASITRSITAFRSSPAERSAISGRCFWNSAIAYCPLTAQLMFCGRIQVSPRDKGGFAIATTTPTTSPFSFTSGPPELPG